jgi:hypothetical protein
VGIQVARLAVLQEVNPLPGREFKPGVYHVRVTKHHDVPGLQLGSVKVKAGTW